jgi:hypothetical protein
MPRLLVYGLFIKIQAKVVCTLDRQVLPNGQTSQRTCKKGRTTDANPAQVVIQHQERVVGSTTCPTVAVPHEPPVGFSASL